MKVLVCGSRYWNNKESIFERLKLLPKDTTIIHGCANGADKLAGIVAKELGFIVVEVPAEWKKCGKRAGILRNLKMLDLKPDLVLAFHSNLSGSKGTSHTLREANKRNILARLYTE